MSSIMRNFTSVIFHSFQRHICTCISPSTRQLTRSLRVYPCSQKSIQENFTAPFIPLMKGCNKQDKLMIKGSQFSLRHISNSHMKSAVSQHISSLQAKKRPPKKKSVSSEDEPPHLKERWTVLSYSTAEEYDLEGLKTAIVNHGLYQPSSLPEDVHDVLHVSALYQVETEPREVYFFREGTLVFWNISDVERQTILNFIRPYEHNPYDNSIVHEESEDMDYIYAENKAKLLGGRIVLSSEGSNSLEKYTFSNGIAISVKLGIWEASLDRFVKSIEWITVNMKTGKKLAISKDQISMKTGELFALRHEINLSSDLLDAPDFYWDRQNLENLYQKTCNHFNVGKRTRVMNEKLNHCCELMELISDNLNDRHHVRLELMIIALIMIEVVFEFIHYLERYGFFGGLSTSSHDDK